MNFLSSLPSIKKLKPMFNVGCLFDIPSGTYETGPDGESILNGGQAHIVAIAGPGNSFKTVIASYFNLTLAERYTCYQCSIYATENNLQYRRINSLAKRFPKMSLIDHGAEDLSPEKVKIKITSAAEEMGDNFFELIKDIYKAKVKDRAKILKDTPFINTKGEVIKIVHPTGVMIDSLSQLELDSLNEKIKDDNAIGDEKTLTLYMRQGLAKRQLIEQSMAMGPNGGMYFTFVAHVGDEFDIGGMFAPKKHKLTHAKKGSKITGTSKNLEFLSDVIYEIFGATLLNNQPRGTGVLYPLSEVDKEEETTDLLLITLKPTRNKNGLSGISLDVIVSQREGLLPHLSQFHYCKENGFGITGSNVSYAFDLYPDVKISRTTVRGKIDEDYKLRRAIEVTSQLLQIKQLWAPLPNDLMCSPETLYKDIKTMGFDWDILLGMTRNYWVFKEDEGLDGLYYLSTMDLLRMRVGDYTPKWYDQAAKIWAVRKE